MIDNPEDLGQWLYEVTCLEFALELDRPRPDWGHLEALDRQLQDVEWLLAGCPQAERP